MFSLSRLITVAALAVSVAGAWVPTPEIAARAECANPSVKTEYISVDGKQVELSTVSCNKNTKTVTTTTATNVCGVNCSITCNNDAGNLPPITEDCDEIEKAIQIFQLSAPATFTVNGGDIKALTWGTCTYWFKNYGTTPLEYCWNDLSVTASRAGSACYPPVFPLRSEGLCKPTSGKWGVASAHSQQ